MDNFIDDIFADEYSGYKSGNRYKNGLDGVVFADTGTIARTINTLSDLFVEWYLFDSTHEKTIESFLFEEGLADVFTVAQFMDLMCGNARLDDGLVSLVLKKLPFPITLNKISKLNVYSYEKYTVSIDGNLLRVKIAEIAQKKEQKRKENWKKYYAENREKIIAQNIKWGKNNPEKVAKYLARWREKNREYILQLARERYKKHKEIWEKYYAENRERILDVQHKYYELNSEKIKERVRVWEKNNKEYCRQRAKKYREKDREKYIERSRKYYEEHKEKQKEYMKKWREAHPDYGKEYREKHQEKCREYARNNYKKNREKINEYSKEYWKKHPEKRRERYLRSLTPDGKVPDAELKKIKERNLQYKQDKEIAVQICPVFQFLESVRIKKTELYLEYFKKNEVVATKAKRNCAALQSGDASLCPICSGGLSLEQMREKCPIDKAFELKNVCDEINKIVATIKSR